MPVVESDSVSYPTTPQEVSRGVNTGAAVEWTGSKRKIQRGAKQRYTDAEAYPGPLLRCESFTTAVGEVRAVDHATTDHLMNSDPPEL